MTTMQVRDANNTLVTIPVTPIGQTVANNSVAVVIAADQSSIPVTDGSNIPFSGIEQLTLDTVYKAKRSLGVLCTTGGNILVQFTDNSTITLPVNPGWQQFPFAITKVFSNGTTANAIFYNLI